MYELRRESSRPPTLRETFVNKHQNRDYMVPPVPKANAAALIERACTSRPMLAECSMVGTSCEYGKPDSFKTEPNPCCRTMATALQSEVPITLHIV